MAGFFPPDGCVWESKTQCGRANEKLSDKRRRAIQSRKGNGLYSLLGTLWRSLSLHPTSQSPPFQSWETLPTWAFPWKPYTALDQPHHNSPSTSHPHHSTSWFIPHHITVIPPSSHPHHSAPISSHPHHHSPWFIPLTTSSPLSHPTHHTVSPPHPTRIIVPFASTCLLISSLLEY